MAEAGDPTLRFDVTAVIYGGRRSVDHRRLGTQNYVKIAALTMMRAGMLTSMRCGIHICP